MKILEWLRGLWKPFWTYLFGTEKSPSIIGSNAETEPIVPEQSGVRMPDNGQAELKSLAEDISKREAALDAELVKAKIKEVSEKLKLRERALLAKIENDKRLAALEAKRLELEAEELRATRSRLDLEKEAELEREQFKTQQEQFRQSNEQAFAQAKQKLEQKEKIRAERRAEKEKIRAERRTQKAKKRRLNRKVWQVRRAGIWNWLTWFANGLRSKLFSKKGGVTVAALGLIALAIWLYLNGSLSAGLNQVLVWLSQAWAWISSLWQYRWYGLAILVTGLVLWLLFSKRFVSKRQSLRGATANAWAKLDTVVHNLSIATGVLFAVGLSVIAMFGAYIGAPWIILGSIGLIPIVAFSWRPGPGLWFRCLITVVLEMFALAAFLPSAY